MIVRHLRPKPIVPPSFLLKLHADLSTDHTQLSPNSARGTFNGFLIFLYPYQPIMAGRANPLFTQIGQILFPDGEGDFFPHAIGQIHCLLIQHDFGYPVIDFWLKSTIFDKNCQCEFQEMSSQFRNVLFLPK